MSFTAISRRLTDLSCAGPVRLLALYLERPMDAEMVESWSYENVFNELLSGGANVTAKREARPHAARR